MSLPDVLPPIRELVPHAGPMVLLDRVLTVDDDNLCAEVAIRPDSLFYDGAGVGSWVGIEYMAQAIAAHAGYVARLRNDPVKVGFLLGSRRYECSAPLFKSGVVLQVHVHRLFQADNGLGSFECRIDGIGGTLATGVLTVFLPANVNDFLENGAE